MSIFSVSFFSASDWTVAERIKRKKKKQKNKQLKKMIEKLLGQLSNQKNLFINISRFFLQFLTLSLFFFCCCCFRIHISAKIVAYKKKWEKKIWFQYFVMVAVAFFAAATVVVAIFDSFTVLFHCIFHFFFSCFCFTVIFKRIIDEG